MTRLRFASLLTILPLLPLPAESKGPKKAKPKALRPKLVSVGSCRNEDTGKVAAVLRKIGINPLFDSTQKPLAIKVPKAQVELAKKALREAKKSERLPVTVAD